MREDYLIKNTTREQREQYVQESLGYGDFGCDGCGSALGYDMYVPYIEGRKELAEITQEFSRGYIRDMEREDRSSCTGKS